MHHILTLRVCLASSSVGNIISPYLFLSREAPEYKTGSGAVLGFYCVLQLAIVLQVLVLRHHNQQNKKMRIKAGKSAEVHDQSMDRRLVREGIEAEDRKELTEAEAKDWTDRQNIDFVYVY